MAISFTWIDLGVPPGESVRTTALTRLELDTDFMVSGIAYLSGVELTKGTKAIAVQIALEEAGRDNMTLLDLIHAWNSVPALSEFAGKVHSAAVRHDKMAQWERSCNKRHLTESCLGGNTNVVLFCYAYINSR